jgi:hypothetical protein
MPFKPRRARQVTRPAGHPTETRQTLEAKLTQLSNFEVEHESSEPTNSGFQTNARVVNKNSDDFFSHSGVNIEDKILPIEPRSIFSRLILPLFGFLISMVALLVVIENTDLFTKLTGLRLSDLLISSPPKPKEKRVFHDHRLQFVPSFLTPNTSLDDGRFIRSPAYSLIAPHAWGLRKRSFIQDKALADWTRNTWEKARRDNL